MTATRLHRLGKLVRIEIPRALENHMLQEMREPGAELRVLVNTAGGHPCLHANDRSRRIGIENQGQPIGQSLAGGVGERVIHEKFRLG